MPDSPRPTPAASPQIDVRRLNMAQLQLLAERGSRRARAELQARLRAATPPAAAAGAPAAAPAAPGTRQPAAFSSPPAFGAPPAFSPPAAGARTAPAITPAQPASPARMDSAPAALPAAAAAPGGDDPRIEQLALLAAQDSARDRADDVPRLAGMVLIGWGVLLLLGGLVMLTRKGGPSGWYYPLLSLGTIGVGWLLLHTRFLAVWLQAGLLMAALAWGWVSAGGSFGLLLAQAAPLLIPASWLAFASVRERLH